MRRRAGVPGRPAAAECVLPAEGDGLDIPAFLRDGGTLYLIARKQGKHRAAWPAVRGARPEVQYQAVLLGSMQPGGRLDPPLLMALDEATRSARCPVPAWLATPAARASP